MSASTLPIDADRSHLSTVGYRGKLQVRTARWIMKFSGCT